MAGTFSQIYIQIVFAVQGRQNLLQKEWRDEVFKYMAGIIKNNSSNFINDHAWIKGKFSWQEGYGAFSYSHSQIDSVYNYILNQKQHHAKQSFKDEYIDFLKKFEIEHDMKYVFEWIE